MKAMILAAGLGTRMRPLTEHTPKPLLRVGGKTLIEWHIDKLRAAGIIDLVINTAWLGEQIEAALGDGGRHGVRIQWSREGTPLETAGGIARALPLLGDAPFVVVNGDIWSDYDYSLLREPADLAHLVLVDNPMHHPDGDFGLDFRGRVHDNGDQRLTFTGIGLYQPQLFHDLPDEPARLAPLLRQAITTQSVTGEHFRGRWWDIGTPERLQQLDTLLS